jgi:hypothetical protein
MAELLGMAMTCGDADRGALLAYTPGMKIITGTVVDGKIELPAESIAEGVHVMVLAPEADEPIRLSPSDERELSEAMEEIRRGEYVDGHELLSELRSRRSA